MTPYDVIVCGAGIEGLWTTYYLVNQKQNVLLLEQFPLNHNRGSSHGPSRITRYSYPTAHHAKMMPEAFQSWSKLEREQNTQLFVECGLITIGSDEKITTICDSLDPLGIKYEVMQQTEIKSRFPGVCSENWKGIFEESGGVLKADQCCQALQQYILSHGGIIHDMEPVLSLQPISDSEVRVVTNKTTYQSRSVVLTCGPWINKMLKTLDLQIPVKPTKICVNYWEARDPNLYKASNNFPASIISSKKNNNYIYSTPIMEYPTLMKVNCHFGVEVDPDFPDKYDKQQSEQNQEDLLELVKTHFPNLIPVPALQEACMVTMTPDKDFIMDHHPKHKNIIIGAGFSSRGFKLSPVVGHILGDLALNRTPIYQMGNFSLKRFNTESSL